MASLGPLLSPDHVNRSNKRPSCLQGARSATPSGRCVHGRAIAAHYLVRACWEEPMSTLERYGPFGAALAPAPPTVLQESHQTHCFMKRFCGRF